MSLWQSLVLLRLFVGDAISGVDSADASWCRPAVIVVAGDLTEGLDQLQGVIHNTVIVVVDEGQLLTSLVGGQGLVDGLVAILLGLRA